jgi:hypothetical protein
MLNIGQCDSDELLKQVMDQIEDPWGLLRIAFCSTVYIHVRIWFW